MEARVEYAGALTEAGDPDAAIRELLEASRFDPRSDSIFSFLARAYLDKEVWDRAVEYSDQAISVRPLNYQAHLWRAEAFRRMAASEKVHRRENYRDAYDDFLQFLRMTDFSTSAAAGIPFYLIGFGLGTRNHAERSYSYEAFRSTGLIGACICGENLQNLRSALKYCQNAVTLDPKDATAHFFTGNVYRDLFNQTLDADAPRCEYLLKARSHYIQAVSINPDLKESAMARTILADINRVAPNFHCQLPPDLAKLGRN